MDVYAAQLLGSSQAHDVFYINPTILVGHFLRFDFTNGLTMAPQAAFKSYVQTVVTQYANEPTILVRLFYFFILF
jgi:mannan endo-1,4-beta-mannosidase